MVIPERRVVLTQAAWELFFTAAALAINGYVIGRGDHAIHLVFLERTLSPDFLKGDLLADSMDRHHSFFWTIQAPLVRLFGRDGLYLVVHVLSWMGMLGGTALLTRGLAPSSEGEGAPWFACVPAAITCTAFAYIPSFDNAVLNRTVVMGPELFALFLALRGRYFWSLLLLGVLFNIHATTASHGAALAMCVALVDPKRWRAIPVGVGAFLLGAAPLLVAVLAAPKGGTAIDYAAWRNAVEFHWPYHHFIGWFGFFSWSLGVIPLMVVLVAIRWTRSRPLAAMLAGIVAMVLVHIIATEMLKQRLAVELHFLEVGRFLTYLGFVGASLVMVAGWSQGGVRRWLGLSLFVVQLSHGIYTYVPSPTIPKLHLALGGVITLALWVMGPRPSEPMPVGSGGWRSLAPAGLMAVAVLVTIWLRGPREFLLVPEDTYSQDPDCHEFEDSSGTASSADFCGQSLMSWAKQHMPAESVLVAPPYFFHPLTNYRFRTGRSLFFSFKDGGEATFDAQYAREWVRRAEVLGGPIPPFQKTGWSTFMGRMHQMRQRYHQHPPERFAQMKKEFGVTHMLCPVNRPCAQLGFPVVYEDSAFRLVSLSDHPSAPSSEPQ